MRWLDGILGHGTAVDQAELASELADYLMEGEQVRVGFVMIRDLLAFTDRHVMIVDKQGLTGRKKQHI
jgi:hypothetical protein